VYTETVRWPLWFHLLLGGAAILVGVSAVRAVVQQGLAVATLIPAPLAVVLLYIWWRFRYLGIEAGPDGLRFGFGRPRKPVPADRIESVEIETYRFTRYMGWGWRVGWQPRDRAWSVLGHPRGVRVRYRDAQGLLWSVFLSSARPEELRAAVGRKEI